MKVYRHVKNGRVTEAQVAERKARAVELAAEQHPDAERVTITSLYGGAFYAAVKMPGDKGEAIYLVPGA